MQEAVDKARCWDKLAGYGEVLGHVAGVLEERESLVRQAQQRHTKLQQ